MQEKISITWNKIQFDINTLWQDIHDILQSRFENNELNKDITDLYDPYLLKDMDKAVERIKKAHRDGERVIIFWDYDVDGVTSTSILMHFFKKIGLQVSYRLPNRITDGYGMKKYFMDELAALWVSLVITVDCWTRDIEVIEYAKTLWIDIIVTDHHAVPEVIPEEAVAIINPKRKDCTYPFKDLSWAWVAFKLMKALARDFFPTEKYEAYVRETIDIAAIGTVADCMPLIDENRIIVLEWLKQIKQSRSLWVRKLIEDRIHKDLDADIFWFLIWPRLNAAGRLDTPYKAVNLLLNNSQGVDDVIADIENINNKRKELTKVFYEHALENIDSKNNILFYHSEKIEHGIIGIVAGKLTEKFYKPSIVLKDEGDKLVASCRSPEYFSMVEYLEKYKEYFLHFGGHKQAAGFSISKEKFPQFQSLFTQELNSLDFSLQKKKIFIDKILSVDDFSFQLTSKIHQFKPYGIGNMKPIFMFQDFEIEQVEYLWKTMEHITLKNKFGINILWFWFGKYYHELKTHKKIDIIFDAMEDVWMGKRQLKAKIIDICL